MPRSCPNCTSEMRVETSHGVRIDVCPKCAGIWFDAEELRVLLAWDEMALIEIEDTITPAVTQTPAGSSMRHCPDCYLPLEQYHYLYTSPVVLDACPECGGFFVEKGELGKMQEWRDWNQRSTTPEEEARVTLAKATIGHEEEISRQHNLHRFFDLLRRYRPGWIGLVP